MSSKLEFDACLGIVHTTLKDLFPQKKFSLERPVGEIILEEPDLEVLRENLQQRLRALSVHLEVPRIEPHLTAITMGRDISDWSENPGSRTIAWSALPGEKTGVDKGKKPPRHGPVRDADSNESGFVFELPIAWSTLPGDPSSPDPGHQPPRPGPVPDNLPGDDAEEEKSRQKPKKHREE